MIETDALIIGAGPAGLFGVFQLGLQGIKAQVVDAQPQAGGQCSALYADKPIYDIPAIPVCSGQELTELLLQQIAPFAPGLHWQQQVSSIAAQADGRWLLTTEYNGQNCQQFLARTIFVAAGVGAFVPKPLKLDGLDAFLERQLFYQTLPAQALNTSCVVIVGGEEQAVSQAVALAKAAPKQVHSITLLHRRATLQANAAVMAEFAALQATGRINFQLGQASAIQTNQQHLIGITVNTPDNQNLNLPLDLLLVCQGISPRLGPISQWGLALERKQIKVDSASFATSAPGIFAVGDIASYPGKKKLIVCAFHEATMAAFAAAALLHPETAGVLPYTSSSALLQQRLGVTPGV